MGHIAEVFMKVKNLSRIFLVVVLVVTQGLSGKYEFKVSRGAKIALGAISTVAAIALGGYLIGKKFSTNNGNTISPIAEEPLNAFSSGANELFHTYKMKAGTRLTKEGVESILTENRLKFKGPNNVDRVSTLVLIGALRFDDDAYSKTMETQLGIYKSEDEHDREERLNELEKP
jgi:hypothetical protein